MRRGSKTNRLLDLWVGVPALNLLAAGHRRRAQPGSVRKVGVMSSPALGDTLLFSGPLMDLRGHFDRVAPSPVEIVHFCMNENLGTAEIIAGADRRVLINLARPHQGIGAMRSEGLDMMVDFTAWQRITALHTLCSGSGFTAGFGTSGQFRRRAFDLAVEHRADRHELENFRSLLTALGIETGSEPAVNVAEFDPAAWRDLWMRSQVFNDPAEQRVDEQVVVLHPWPAGAQSWLREWPEPHWIEFARSLSAESWSLDTPRTRFVVTGSPSDQPRVGLLVKALRESGVEAVGFAPPGGLRSLVALLHRASLAVCVNTGIMHLAAIAGTPTLGLNGPTSDRRWGPRGRCARGLGPADGSGAYLNFGFEYPRNPEDVMSRIAVADALHAARELMACGVPL